MARKQIYLDREQWVRLKELAARLGVSESSLIRQAVQTMLGDTARYWSHPQAWEMELEFARNVPPVGGPRTWSRDELYE
jgi:hypothetical protein